MNTDNTSISGETIDYGPCAFMEAYDPATVFSSIHSTGGRYAFANQPRIAQWNCTRLAEALLPLLAEDEEEAVRLATERLERFTNVFQSAYTRVLRAKLGLEREEDGDCLFAEDLLGRLAANEVDYTLFFRRLCGAAADRSADATVAAMFRTPGAFYDWAESWRSRLGREERQPRRARGSDATRQSGVHSPKSPRRRGARGCHPAGRLRAVQDDG